jgi:hypothetical protein
MVLGCTFLELAMSDVLIVIIAVALVFFTAWFSKLSSQLKNGLDGLGGTDDDIQEIKEGIEIVAAVLAKLPELMPQFNMNTSPLTPIFEAFAKKLSGEQPLITYEGTRDSEGKFHGTPKEQTEDSP